MATQVTPPNEPDTPSKTSNTESSDIPLKTVPENIDVKSSDTTVQPTQVTPQDKVEEAIKDPTPSEKALQDYVHVPGTTHVNAYITAVDEAKTELAVAQGKLNTAETALKAKLGL